MNARRTSHQALVLLSTKLAAPREADPSPADLLQTVRWAEELGRLSDARLRVAVQDARSHSVSWQSIGDVLKITRQAAFKKFSVLPDESKEYLDVTQPEIDLVDRTESVFRSLSREDFGAVKSLMTYTCSRSLTKKKVMGMWDEMVESTGRLETISNTAMQSADGRDVVERLANRHLINGVVQTKLHHEAGEWVGRVAYNNSGKIAGLLVTSVGSENLAF